MLYGFECRILKNETLLPIGVRVVGFCVVVFSFIVVISLGVEVSWVGAFDSEIKISIDM